MRYIIFKKYTALNIELNYVCSVTNRINEMLTVSFNTFKLGDDDAESHDSSNSV